MFWNRQLAWRNGIGVYKAHLYSFIQNQTYSSSNFYFLLLNMFKTIWHSSLQITCPLTSFTKPALVISSETHLSPVLKKYHINQLRLPSSGICCHAVWLFQRNILPPFSKSLFNHEGGSNIFLQNTGECQPDYVASHPRGQ